jgi:hypothetical protein
VHANIGEVTDEAPSAGYFFGGQDAGSCVSPVPPKGKEKMIAIAEVSLTGGDKEPIAIDRD